MFERDRGHERLAGQRTPWRHEGDRRDHNDVEHGADDDRRKDGARESPRAKLGIRLLGSLGHRLISRHVIRDNLQHQQNRYKRSVREQRRKIRRRSARDANRDEDHEKRQRAERRPILKRGAQPYAAIVHHRDQRREREPDDQMWQVNRLSRDAV